MNIKYLVPKNIMKKTVCIVLIVKLFFNTLPRKF